MASQETLTALSAIMDEDALLELLEESESHEDPDAYLAAKLNDATRGDVCSNGSESTSLVERFGMTVEVNYQPHKPTNGPVQEIPNGYKIKRLKDTGAVNYAGLTLTWTATETVFDPFETEQDAMAGALSLAVEMEEAKRRLAMSIRHHIVKIPYARVDAPSRGCKVQVQLDNEQTHKVEAIRTALREVNAEYEPGKPVDSNADVIRWLLAKCVA